MRLIFNVAGWQLCKCAQIKNVCNDFLGGNACINVLGHCHNWLDRQQKCINDHFLEMDDFLENVN